MNVFLSWSGELSHQVAVAFKEWLPQVIQSVIPYVSSEDIEKGTRWSLELAQEIENSRYGVICVTKENVSQPWLNFEAGALSRSIEKTAIRPFSSAVSPFLFDLQSSELEGPLTQFQYVKNERSEIAKLVTSINSKLEPTPLKPDMIDKAFEKWWPDLEYKLAAIAAKGAAKEEPKADDKQVEDILTDLLDLVRAQQRAMISREEFTTLFASVRDDISHILQQAGLGFSFGSPFQRTGFIRGVVNRPLKSGLFTPTVVASGTTVFSDTKEPASDFNEKEAANRDDGEKKA